MAEITMPKLSDTMTEGVVVRWHKKKGDVVATGDVLAEIETDKATMEMEAFDDGVLKEIYVPEGQKVSVGERIALIGNEHESPSAPVQKVDALPKRIVSQEKAPARKPKPDEIQHAHKTASVEEGYSQAVPKKTEPAAAEGAKGVRVKASPLARKTATQMSVDLARIEGSGPGGRIIQEDVFTAAKAKASGPVPVRTTPETESELIPLSPMRRVIAQRMVESKTTIPHFYLTVELDVAKLLELRAQANESLAATGGGKLSINDFVLKACVECLQRVPQLNSSFTQEWHPPLHSRPSGFCGKPGGRSHHAGAAQRRAKNATAAQRGSQGNDRARPRKEAEARRISGWNVYRFESRRFRHRQFSSHHQPASVRNPCGWQRDEKTCRQRQRSDRGRTAAQRHPMLRSSRR